MTEQEKRVLNEQGVDTLMAEIAMTIRQEFAAEAESLRRQVYPVVGMAFVGSETNVQALAQFGIEGKTYFLGDTSTANGAVPAGAMYYKEGDTVVFVTTEVGDYIETTPLDGSLIEVEYSSNVTYLGGL